MKINGYRLFFAVAGLLAFFAAPVSADEDYTLKAGVCRFVFIGGGEDNLSGGLSRNVLESVADIDERTISSEEIAEILIEEKNAQLVNKQKELEALYGGRDALLYESSDRELDSDIKTEIKKIEDKLAEIDDVRAAIGEIRSDVDAKDFSSVELIISGSGDDDFYELKPGNPSATAEAHGLDLLIFGSVSELEDYYLVEIKIWNNIVGRLVYDWKTAVGYSDVEEEIRAGLDGLRTAVLGRGNGREWRSNPPRTA